MMKQTMSKQKIVTKLENKVKTFNLGILAIILGIVDMFLCAPFLCLVFTKMTNDKEWADKHRILELLSVVVMTSCALLGFFAVALFKMAYKALVILSTIIHTGALVLLPMVTAESKFNSGVEALKILTMVIGSAHVLSSVASLFITSELMESSKQLKKIFLKSYVPAILATVMSCLVIHFAITKQEEDKTYIPQYIWYTFGLEVLLASTYFTAIYNMLKYGTKSEDEETKEEQTPIVAV